LKPNDVTALTWYIRSLSTKGGDLTTGKKVGLVKHAGAGANSSAPATAPSVDVSTQPSNK
jgi:hypothetical protein